MAEIAATPDPPQWREWDRRELEELRECGPRYLPSEWFCKDQMIAEKYRVRYLRALHALADAGIVELTTNGGRVYGVKLTEEGQKIAATLTKRSAKTEQTETPKLLQKASSD
jgi:hypothetical protein